MFVSETVQAVFVPSGNVAGVQVFANVSAVSRRTKLIGKSAMCEPLRKRMSRKADLADRHGARVDA